MPRGVSERPRKKGPDPVDVHVGEQIRRFRVTKELSQTKIAEALGLTFQQIQKYEKGTNRVSAGKLQKLATLLDVRVEDFFPPGLSNGGDEGSVNGIGDPLIQLAQTRGGVRLARAYVAIDSSQKRKILVSLIEAMAGIEVEEQ